MEIVFGQKFTRNAQNGSEYLKLRMLIGFIKQILKRLADFQFLT
jgi:hypothetical protein